MRALRRWVLSLLPRSFPSANVALLASGWSLGVEARRVLSLCNSSLSLPQFSSPWQYNPCLTSVLKLQILSSQLSQVLREANTSTQTASFIPSGMRSPQPWFLINMTIPDFYILEIYASHQFTDSLLCTHLLLESAWGYVMWPFPWGLEKGRK